MFCLMPPRPESRRLLGARFAVWGAARSEATLAWHLLGGAEVAVGGERCGPLFRGTGCQ